MSAADVQTEIIEPMQRLYFPPRNVDETEQTKALQQYVDVLGAYGGGDLHEAWIAVISTHSTRSWPLPAAILLAVRKSRSERNAESGITKTRDADNFTAKRQQWDKIRVSNMAREAVRGGFAWSLKCAVVNDGKTAEQIDTRELQSAHNSAVKTAESLQAGERVWDRFRGKWVTFSDETAAAAVKMWRNLLVKEAETAEEIRRAGSA